MSWTNVWASVILIAQYLTDSRHGKNTQLPLRTCPDEGRSQSRSEMGAFQTAVPITGDP